MKACAMAISILQSKKLLWREFTSPTPMPEVLWLPQPLQRDRLVAFGFPSLSSVASPGAAQLLSATFDRFHFHRPVFCAFNCPHRHFLNSLL